MACHLAGADMRRRVCMKLLGSLALGFLLSVGDSAVAEYPERPVNIIVPFAAGGPSDVMARILADRMRLTLNQPVLVENVTGADWCDTRCALYTRRLHDQLWPSRYSCL